MVWIWGVIILFGVYLPFWICKVMSLDKFEKFQLLLLQVFFFNLALFLLSFWDSDDTNVKTFVVGRWEGGSGWGIHVKPWLILVNVWQKPLQYCKVISLQLIKKKLLKKKVCCSTTGPWVYVLTEILKSHTSINPKSDHYAKWLIITK